MQEVEQVSVDPELDELAIPYSCCCGTREVNRPAGGRKGAERPQVCSAGAKAQGGFVPLGQHVLDGHREVWEGGAELSDRLLVPVSSRGVTERRIVVDEVRRQDDVR